MLTEYAGWQISDDKQREIEAQIVKKQLQVAAEANRGRTPGWLRLQLHYLGVRMEHFGERMQIECEQRREALSEESGLGAAV